MVKTDTQYILDQFAGKMRDLLGDDIAATIIQMLCETAGGMRLTIPPPQDFYKIERDKRIRNLFNGANYSELSERFGLHERTIRRILDLNKKK